MSKSFRRPDSGEYRATRLARIAAVSASAALVIAGFGPASAATASAADGVPVPSTISAPSAPDPVVMDCSDGQIDVNAPDADAFAPLPTPDGGVLDTPTRRRIVEGQPYLQPSDLLAVSGVTADHIELWLADGTVCATPPSLPPPAPDACVDEIDVNSAGSVEQLAAIYGRPTADRLVGGIPYPTVVNALRIAGVGPGAIKKTQDKLCATPYPIRHDGVDWAYATSDAGIAVDTSGGFGIYTLTVPGGATSGTGAWASLTETNPEFTDGLDLGFDLEIPSVDAHIHGAWTGFVAVALPPDPTVLGEGYVDTVIHYSGSGVPEIHANDALSVGADGRLSVVVDDLSVMDAVKISTRWTNGLATPVAFQAWVEQKWRDAMGLGTSVRCDPDLTGVDLPSGEKFTVEGQMLEPHPLTPPLDHCITRTHSAEESPDVRLGVNRGIVNIMDSTSGVTVHDVSTVNSLQGIVFSLVNQGRPANGGQLYLTPGASFLAHPDNYAGSFHMRTAGSTSDVLWTLLPTAAYYLFDEIGSFVPPGLPDALRNLLVTQPNCVLAVGSAFQGALSGETEALGAATGVLTTLLTCAADGLDKTSPNDIAQWLPITVNQSILLDRLKRAAAVLKWAKYATVLADSIGLVGLNGTVNLSWRPQEPALPATDSQGRALVAECASKRFSYSEGWVITVDNVCQDLAYGEFPEVEPPVTQCSPVDAFDDWVGSITCTRMYNLLRRDAGGVLHLILLEGAELVAHPIDSEDEWSFKEDWPEDEWRSSEFDSLVDRIGVPAVNDPLRLRGFTQGRGHSWLLRQADGTAWWIDPEGVRHWIPDLQAQQNVSNNYLTLHPAQWANDICPYPGIDEPTVRVCG